MKIGTIGTGSIVTWVMTEAMRTEGVEYRAVYSRKEESGRALAGRFGVQKVYTDLDAMLADETIDFIYVASPNSLHYEQARRALLAGKNVICEKPFAPTRAQAAELAALAQQKQRFLFEGITTAFLPPFRADPQKTRGNRAGAAGFLHLLPVFEQIRHTAGGADAQCVQPGVCRRRADGPQPVQPAFCLRPVRQPGAAGLPCAQAPERH